MATLSLSGQQSYVGGTAGGSPLFGYDSNGNRVVRYTFTTGSVGASTVTLKGTIAKSLGDFNISSSYPMLFKITSSSTSHANAGSTSSYDGKITSTTVNVTANVNLKANTTYYLWLFPGHTKYSLYYAYDASSNPTLNIVTEIVSYKLTTNAGTGSAIEVNRTSSPYGGAATGVLASGATIYHNDVLKITFSASAGYDLATHTVNGSAFTSGGTHTVTAAVSVVSTASKKTFTLSISQGTGSGISVKRNGATLSHGATITYGDSLVITFSASTGYNLATHTVNGSAFTSVGTHSVTSAVSVVSTASVKSFKLSISAGTGSTIAVNRTSSPLQGAATGTIANGATIYYNDVLKITTSASGGYEITAQTFNGSSFASGASKTVTAAVTIVTITALMGLVYIDNGTTVEAYLVFIDNGTNWEQYVPCIDNGSSWDICN